MSDYRNEFLRSVEESLLPLLGGDDLGPVVDVVTRVLNDYEITARCTDVAPFDDGNEKLMKRYAACLSIEGKAEKTIRQYVRSLKLLSEVIPKPFPEYGVYDIRYYLACEKQRGLSNVSLENIRANLSAFFRWMSKEGITQNNVMESIAPIKIPKEVKEPFSDVEIDALRGGCRNQKERALVETLLSTGVRVDELSRMDISDINFGTMTVHVKHGKGSKERVTYISSVAKKHLVAYLESRSDENTALFLNYRYDRISNNGIRSLLNEIAKIAGVSDVHPHRFRRTFATRLASRGMDVQEIQRLLGHSNLNTTMRYIRVDDAQVHASYRKYIA